MLSSSNKVASTVPGRSSRAARFVLAGALVLSLAAAGCGSDKEEAPSAAAQEKEEQAQQEGLSKESLAPVNIDIEAGPLAGPVPLKTRFSADAPDTDGEVIYRWRFDDGTTSTEQNPTHVFKKPGFYLVVVNTRDSKGEVRTRGAFIGAWPPDQWGHGQRLSSARLNFKRRSKGMWARTFERRAELFAKVRAEQRRQAAASPSL